MAALYQTYRPQTFSEIVGQKPIIRTLQNALKRDRISHAYLFAGPKGVGKTSMARILAKAMNCAQGPAAEPCNTCHACRAITASSSFDVTEMDAASQRGIDDIREIRSRSILAPAEGRVKFYIIDEAHQLTDAAWNALLKLIEEPPPHLHFVFCTTEADKVPETVRSRCQTFLFARPSVEEIQTALRHIAETESIEAADASIALISEQAHGSLRDAISLLDQLATGVNGTLDEESARELMGLIPAEQLSEFGAALAAKEVAGAIGLIGAMASAGADFSRVLRDLADYLRKLLLAKHLSSATSQMKKEAALFEEAALVGALDLVAGAAERRGDPRLNLELAVAKICVDDGIGSRLQRIENQLEYLLLPSAER